MDNYNVNKLILHNVHEFFTYIQVIETKLVNYGLVFA
jgi:hypothetical protein